MREKHSRQREQSMQTPRGQSVLKCFRSHRETSLAGVERGVAEVEASETEEGSGLSVL